MASDQTPSTATQSKFESYWKQMKPWHIRKSLVRETHLLILPPFLQPWKVTGSSLAQLRVPHNRRQGTKSKQGPWVQNCFVKSSCWSVRDTSSSPSCAFGELPLELLWGVTPMEVSRWLANTSLKRCLCRCFLGVVLPPVVCRRLTDGDVGGNLRQLLHLSWVRRTLAPPLFRDDLKDDILQSCICLLSAGMAVQCPLCLLSEGHKFVWMLRLLHELCALREFSWVAFIIL